MGVRMTATTIAPDSPALWDDSRNYLSGRRITVLWDRGQPAPATPSGSLYAIDWKRGVIARLSELVDAATLPPSVDALRRLIRLVDSLPTRLPMPFVAMGEGGAMALEWDIQGIELHITVDRDCDEAYVRTPDGEEREGTLSPDAGWFMDAVHRLAAVA